MYCMHRQVKRVVTVPNRKVDIQMLGFPTRPTVPGTHSLYSTRLVIQVFVLFLHVIHIFTYISISKALDKLKSSIDFQL